MTTKKEKIKKDTPSLVEELLNYKERLNMALKVSKTCIFEVDLTRQLYTVFENAEVIFGVSGESILNDVQPFHTLSPEDYEKACSEYFSHPGDKDTISDAFHKIFSGKSATYQARMKAGNSQYTWCQIAVSPVIKNGKPVKMIGVISDINEMKLQNDELQEKAGLDSFTNLYHKNKGQQLIETTLQEFPKQKHALILFDLDNFKEINDKYGHLIGDQVLKSTADELKKIFRRTDIIGRFGGDEFFVLMKNIPDEAVLLSKLKQLLSNKQMPYHTTKSIGVALYPNHAANFSELFRKADAALYQAKKCKNCYSIFPEFSE